ncbi:MAG: S46 family peptidase [Acidobacteria bacterium]|nr:S46 family peptidase [Acidobacteriota bacterium]
MNRKLISLVIILVVTLIIPITQFADEGMWLMQDIKKLPIAEMRAKGLQLSPEEIYNPDGTSLKDAVFKVRIGGGGSGTGSFISSQGLIITNHHVAFDGIASASTPEKNYLDKGYVASSQVEEIPMKGYNITIAREIKNVTQDVLSVVKPEMSPEEVQKAIDAKRREIIENARKQNEALEYEVSEMLVGLKYMLHGYEVIRDIRLVYAPPKSVGFFGGDDDNFLWPRHTGDYSFLRAYVGPDGKPAAYSDKNIAYKPSKFLPISLNGYKEGEFTMILGYPGRTFRLQESYAIDFQQNVFLPFINDILQARINLLDEAGKQDPSKQLAYASERFSLSNALKNFQGSLEGIKRTQLVEKKQAEEAKFKQKIAQDSSLQSKYGDLFSKLEKLYTERKANYMRNSILGGMSTNVTTLRFVSLAVGRALDKEKAESERSPFFSDARVEQFKKSLPEALKEADTKLDSKLIALYLNKALDLPEGQKIPFIEERFASRQGEARQGAVNDFARQLVEEFNNADSIGKLFSLSATDIRSNGSVTLKFLLEANSELEKTRKIDQNFTTNIPRLRSLYIDGMSSLRNELSYPDANSTLRFTYGEVKGYKPRDGVHYRYFTTLQGVVDKDTGKEPFDVPNSIKQINSSKNFTPYDDAATKDMVVAFMTTNDITGGNSGSPVINGRGEMIGVAFDGNYEGLGSDYGYNEAQSRTICVDIRYVLLLAERMAGANNIFKELEIRGKGATAGTR